MKTQIVLVEPEIPQNTGNIARTCAAIGASLHLVEPLGFSLENRYLKRAGLDYWPEVELTTYPSLDSLFDRFEESRAFYVTTKGMHAFSEPAFPEETVFLFGKETAGLPEWLLDRNRERTLRIPMRPGTRSLNLSNSVAVVAYEHARQYGYVGLRKEASR
ncbi:MAG: tRNA (cytidine(34)-2'-O)-methyltransferase [Alkalispirochaetaceae bacterium]